MDCTSSFRLYRQLLGRNTLLKTTRGPLSTTRTPKCTFATVSPQTSARDPASVAPRSRKPFISSLRPSRDRIGSSSLLGNRYQSTSSPGGPPSEGSGKGGSDAATAAGEKRNTTYNQKPYLRPQGAPEDVPAPEPNERGEVPAYELTFTCKPCKTRSSHRISKHGYHNGTVLITCPQCKNRHVISDHLQIFNDSKKSFDQILKEKGELLKTGVLDPDGDIELWDDGTQSSRDRAVQESAAQEQGTSDK